MRVTRRRGVQKIGEGVRERCGNASVINRGLQVVQARRQGKVDPDHQTAADGRAREDEEGRAQGGRTKKQ